MTNVDQLDLFSSAPLPHRVFLSWERPLLEQAAEWLLARVGDAPLLDLSDLLVIVPTRNAGRRLREMLANLADERGKAVMPPLVAPPSILVSIDAGAAHLGRAVAGDLESIAGWIKVLMEIDLEDYRFLLPMDPPARDFSWARGMARDLDRLRASLGESGLSFSEVSRVLPPDHEEVSRWADLARLEGIWIRTLEKLGKIDRESARSAAVALASLPEGTREIVIMGTPDPFPLAVDALEILAARGVPLTVAIYAPESMAATFDPWGRPLSESWLTLPLEIPDFHQSVEIVANPDALIERVTESASQVSHPAETLAIGAVDSEMAPLLESALIARDIPAFNPEGSRVSREGFCHLLGLLGKLLNQAEFETARELLRLPEMGAYLRRQVKAWRPRAALRALDECQAEHIATDLTSLIAFLKSDAESKANSERESEQKMADSYRMAAESLLRIRELHEALRSQPLPRVLPPLLRDLISARHRGGPEGAWAEKVIESSAAPLMAGLAQLDSLLKAGMALSPADQFTLLIDLVGELGLSEDRPPCAIELQGWLELLWEDAPHLIVAGLNDGIVPGAIVGDAFLPENLRRFRALRLTTNDDRLVRDLYLLHAMLASRRDSGRVDLLVPKTTADGDPLRPSRLLFRCADHELPDRVAHLFREVDTPGSQASWTPGFQLVPGLEREGQPEKKPRPIAVTAFARYLASPFHFWANQVTRMSEIDPDKSEMNDMDFGNFCHAVLEQYGRNPEARQWTDPEEIEAFFLQAADSLSLARFGPRPGLAIRIQLDSARRRLAEVAHHEAEQRQSGWEIIGAEIRLQDAYPLCLGGLEISGTIDRIERNGDSIRVLDYKTSDKKNPSLRDHLSEITQKTAADWPPDYARFEHLDFFPRSRSKAPEPKSYRFKKLQLPLYALAISLAEPDVEIRCGYFHLTKAVADVGPDDWVADSELLTSTRSCAEGVIGDVLAGRFDRLNANGRFDDLEPLHLGLPERTLDLTHVGAGDESPRSS